MSQNQILFLGTFFYFIYLLVSHIRKNILVKETDETIGFIHKTMKILFIIYCIFVVSKVFFPIDFSLEANKIFRLPNVWLNPISSLETVLATGKFNSVYQFGGNLVLLSPLAFFYCFFSNKDRISFIKIIIFTFKTTLLIECAQILLSLGIPSVSRYFEINDLILNTMGAAIGYYGFIVFAFILRIFKEEKVLQLTR
ncbi:MAG: VanZ family protein [Sarcina sp.]